MEEETNNAELLTQPSVQCRICGDMALHANYGSLTCFACKMFFKRNAPIRGVTRSTLGSSNLIALSIFRLDFDVTETTTVR